MQVRLRLAAAVALSIFYLTDSKAQQFTDSSFLGGDLASQVLESAIEHKNREVHYVLTTTLIDKTPSDELVLLVTDHIRTKMHKDLSNEAQVVSKLSEPQRMLYIVSQVEAEVNAGGFDQFFAGSASAFTEQAAAAFRAMNAAHFASLVEKAVSLHKEGGRSASFHALNNTFSSLYTKEDLRELKIKYIRKNKKMFADQ